MKNMKLKQGYKLLSILSIILGLGIVISTQNSTVGNAIAGTNITNDSLIIWGAFFLIVGIILYYLQAHDKK
jgi:predicted membrane channel-forming protein YqfA (hemolysin III family)